MASILKVDTLTGVTTAGSIAVTGEGNSTTTNLQQGLAKSWVNFNGTSTIAARDSSNVGSLTDNGTGDYSVNFSNSMGNANYCVSFHATANTNFNNFQSYRSEQGTLATSSVRVGTNPDRGGGREDVQFVHVGILGDLA